MAHSLHVVIDLLQRVGYEQMVRPDSKAAVSICDEIKKVSACQLLAPQLHIFQNR